MSSSIASLNALGGSGDFGAGPPSRACLSAAKALMPGAGVLAAHSPACGEAHTLLAGFVVEGCLKAVLAHSSYDERKLRSGGHKHDLVALWKLAASASQFLPGVVPDWVDQLNVFHNAPYVLRYRTRVNAYSLPKIGDIQAGVETLLNEVCLHVHA